jgi:hypothetical protein
MDQAKLETMDGGLSPACYGLYIMSFMHSETKRSFFHLLAEAAGGFRFDIFIPRPDRIARGS